ncbi:MAG: hypothetical protein GXY52_01890 [Chloroflexi bacterium]|nr:hypothetical protein [Chloroflexota bacterium]
MTHYDGGAHQRPDRPPHTAWVFGILLAAALLAAGQLIALARSTGRSDIAMLAATGTFTWPTTTPTRLPTSTATSTATPSPTALPPVVQLPSRGVTAMPLPTLARDASPVMPREGTPIATRTPLPPLPPVESQEPYPAPDVGNVPAATFTPRPPLQPSGSGEPYPPPASGVTHTAVPGVPNSTPSSSAEVIERVTVNNGEWGEREIIVRYDETATSDVMYFRAADGAQYRVVFGFINTPEALAAVRTAWAEAKRGSANWGMVITVRKSVSDWYQCTESMPVCYTSRIDSGQAVVFVDVYLRNAAWQSLLNDYLAIGLPKLIENANYPKLQEAVFEPMVGSVPATRCIGVTFTRVN